MNPDHEQFGASCGNSRWFKGEPTVTESSVVPVQLRWTCPVDGCGGEMRFNGFVWQTRNQGFHHTCSKCDFTAAVHEKFPRVEYRPAATTEAT